MANSENTLRADVIVVGAGLSGLTAAHRLLQQGMSVGVLEAQDRLGGRIHDHRSRSGHVYPLAAEWLGTEEARLHALLDEFGLKTTPQYSTGRFLFETQAELRHCDDTDAVRLGQMFLPRDNLTQATLETMQLLDEMSCEVPLEAPHLAPRAQEWDQLTALKWCEENIQDPAARARFLFIANDEPPELDSISLLHYLFLRRSITRRIVDDRRVLGGAHQLCQSIGERLGGAVHLQSPVTAIHQDDAGVRVETPSGIHRARFIIVAAAVGGVARIRYTPELPAELRGLWAHGTLGRAIKCYMIYKEPFWRAMNFSGMGLSERGPLTSFYDACSADGAEAALVGFIRGAHAREWAPRPQSARHAAIVDQLVRLFGAAAAEPVEYFDKSWPGEDFTGGAYCLNLPPGAISGHGQALRRPVGRIHWAGTETEAEWNGCMEGAIRAGERAAAEVCARSAG